MRSKIAFVAVFLFVFFIPFAAAQPKNLDWFAADSQQYIDRNTGIWAVGKTMRVMDVETGKVFSAYRRGGSRHVDWEPATASDTATLSEICEGEWSWDPRPVLVEIGSEVFAGSINLMPHGKDKLPDNDYPGHSCLHFLNSTTHGSGRVHKGHQAAIEQAMESSLSF